MKKILITVFLIGISMPTYSYAAGACLIKDKSAQVLLDYIKNNRQIIKNITKSINENNQKENTLNENTLTDSNSLKNKVGKNVNKIKNQLNIAGNESMTIFNEMFNFIGYYSYFKYYVTFPISNEIPYEVIRDYKIIDNENKGMLEYLKKIDIQNQASVVIENACEGVDESIVKTCSTNLNNKKTKEIISKLIKNNNYILDFYRLTIMGTPEDFIGKKIIIVDKKFKDLIEKYYGTNALNICKNNGDGFFKQIKTSIEGITLVNKQGIEGIQKWKDAFQLLIGNDLDQEDEIAQKELKKYLSNMGISTDKESILQNNLLEYKNGGISFNNNFISNTFSSIRKQVDQKLKKWAEETYGDYNNTKNGKGNNTISINQMEKDSNNSKISKNIQTKITNLYQNEIPFAAIGDISTENLRSKIMDTHFTLDSSINTISETCKKSVQTCEDQGGGGNCGSCN